ncbi:MAG TPA: helix-hairpin-helix domain-containing protein, partial [Bacillota bacterium]|nr:helix-hairpin-helix domain-containing protein [Bacillota bacterium]
AMAIVGQFQPAEFSLAVISGDVKTLTGIKGLGKKGAERIVLELKDKLKGFAFRDTDMTSSVSLPSTSEALSSLEEASAALVVLGYPASEALMAVKSVYEDGMSVEEIIPKALRRMVRS